MLWVKRPIIISSAYMLSGSGKGMISRGTANSAGTTAPSQAPGEAAARRAGSQRRAGAK